MVTERSDEIRLRRKAARRGFVVRKNRRRDRLARDYGAVTLRFDPKVFPEELDFWAKKFPSMREAEAWLDSGEYGEEVRDLLERGRTIGGGR